MPFVGREEYFFKCIRFRIALMYAFSYSHLIKSPHGNDNEHDQNAPLLLRSEHCLRCCQLPPREHDSCFWRVGIEGVGMSPFERFDLMHGSPADEAPEYELTEDDIVLAFECASELECDFCCDIERVQTDAYLNDDAESLQALTDWMDAISVLPFNQKLAVIETMRTLPWCGESIKAGLESIETAAYLNRRAA